MLHRRLFQISETDLRRSLSMLGLSASGGAKIFSKHKGAFILQAPAPSNAQARQVLVCSPTTGLALGHLQMPGVPGGSVVLKQIRGDPFQCWGSRPAAGRKFPPNIKERLFCKRPHHPMLKEDNGLCALARPALLLVIHRCRALHNIEEEGGRTVSEVGERYFCKHRYPRRKVRRSLFEV